MVKKIFIGILSAFLIAVAAFYYMVLLSPMGRKTQRNAKNVEKVKEGMSVQQVLEIMGKPDTIFPSYYKDGNIIYQYEPPFASSEGIDIYIDSSKVVKRVVFE